MDNWLFPNLFISSNFNYYKLNILSKHLHLPKMYPDNLNESFNCIDNILHWIIFSIHKINISLIAY